MDSDPPRSAQAAVADDDHDLALVRRHLAWSPAERLEHLKQAVAFVERVRKGRWLPAEQTDDPREDR
jgi:hypothetical protein